jgi:hypothetical protein
LEKVRAWRLGVIEFLAHSSDEPNLQAGGWSPRARSALRFFLSGDWSEEGERWAAAAPDNLSAFPVGLLISVPEAALNAVLEVFRWRAAVLDLLSDIWDVFDEPDLDLAECTAIEELLWPPELRDRCSYCLRRLEPQECDWHNDHCLLLAHVRARWPSTPPAFATWKDEAEIRAAEASAAALGLPCRRCGAMILPTTAQATGGLCMPCRNKEPGGIGQAGEAGPTELSARQVLGSFVFEIKSIGSVGAGFAQLLKNDLEAVPGLPDEVAGVAQILEQAGSRVPGLAAVRMSADDTEQSARLRLIELRKELDDLLALFHQAMDLTRLHQPQIVAACGERSGECLKGLEKWFATMLRLRRALHDAWPCLPQG